MSRSEYAAHIDLTPNKSQQTIAKLNAEYRKKKLQREAANKSLFKKILDIIF